MRRPNLTIIWRASKLQMGPRRFPWLIGTHLDHAQGSNTGSCPNGSLQPVLLLCRASVLGNPKGYYRDSHTLEQKVYAFGWQTEEKEAELLARIAHLEAQRGSADEDYRAFRQQLGVDGQQLAKALQKLEGRVDQAAGRQSVSDSVQELKTEINRVEQEAIQARQIIDQRLKGYEDAGAWTTEDLATEFGKWQAMHRESVRQAFKEQFATMEQRLMGMEKAVGELKGLQTQMVEFQTSQDFVVADVDAHGVSDLQS